MNGGENKPADPALELYKLEYERCAIRYEDIYKAIWTNFSYLAVVAGAILTFGGDRFQPEVSALLACLPLFFWWLATFEPLNRYGDRAATRLKEIEETVNGRYHTTLNHYTSFEARGGIGVRWRVRAFFVVLVITALWLSWRVCELQQAGKPLIHRKSSEAETMTIDLKEKPLEIKLTGIDLNELKRILEPQG